MFNLIKNQLLLVLAVILMTPMGFAGNGGSGGDGYALLFTHLGYRLHRELLMEDYNETQVQIRDAISMEKFLFAIETVKVISTTNQLFDRDGHEQTALYFTQQEFGEYLNSNGIKREVSAQYPLGIIMVNQGRFDSQLKSQLGIALGLVFHEYARAMGVPEDNYTTLAKTFDVGFFSRLEQAASPVTQQVFSEARSFHHENLTKIDLIDKEKERLEREIEEDLADLKVKTIERRPYVDAQRVAYSNMINAVAAVTKNINVISLPSGRSAAKAIKGMGKVGSHGIDYQQKLSEVEVINMQVAFLQKNSERNMDFYERIDLVRQELFLEMVRP